MVRHASPLPPKLSKHSKSSLPVSRLPLFLFSLCGPVIYAIHNFQLGLINPRCEDDAEVRREAARLLFALSLNELNKLDVAGLGDGGAGGGEANPATAEVATDLVALARSDDPSCARNAVGALANLSENDATHERLLGWGASFLSNLALEGAPTEGGGGWVATKENANDGSVDEMVEGGDVQTAAGGSGSVDVGLFREVTRCLANLAGNYATHEKLLDGGAADALVGSLQREDAVTARFAALGLANLAGQVGGTVLYNVDDIYMSPECR